MQIFWGNLSLKMSLWHSKHLLPFSLLCKRSGCAVPGRPCALGAFGSLHSPGFRLLYRLRGSSWAPNWDVKDVWALSRFFLLPVVKTLLRTWTPSGQSTFVTEKLDGDRELQQERKNSRRCHCHFLAETSFSEKIVKLCSESPAALVCCCGPWLHTLFFETIFLRQLPHSYHIEKYLFTHF